MEYGSSPGELTTTLLPPHPTPSAPGGKTSTVLTSSAGALVMYALDNPPISTWTMESDQPLSTHSARDGRWFTVVASLVQVQRLSRRRSGLHEVVFAAAIRVPYLVQQLLPSVQPFTPCTLHPTWVCFSSSPPRAFKYLPLRRCPSEYEVASLHNLS